MSELLASTRTARVRPRSQVRRLHRGVWAEGEESPDAELAAVAAAGAALLAVPTGWLVDDWAAWALAPDRIGPPRLPVRVGVSQESAVESRRGLTVRHSDFLPHELVIARGMPVSAATRTAVDVLCDWRRLGRPRAIELVDALLNLGLTTQDDIAAGLAASHQRGVVRARLLVEETEPLAESGQETRLRLLVVDHGMARPVAQLLVRDDDDAIIARCDLGWEALDFGLEYLGEVHKEQLAGDWGRQFDLNARGLFVMGITAEHMRTPHALAGKIRAQMLRQARLLGVPLPKP
ncbi:MAG TPA: hypothetical protein VHE83_18785 [Mycobacteriales bacterium]|nr:hypothetical protein [Mycobacteriales bacterium]